MLIECGTCRAKVCGDCVIATLLPADSAPVPIELDNSELAALGLLADLGMIPPIRHEHVS